MRPKRKTAAAKKAAPKSKPAAKKPAPKSTARAQPKKKATTAQKRKKTTPPPVEDYSSWTVAKLKAACVDVDLDTSGKKAQLVSRLTNFHGGVVEDDEEAPVAKVPKPTKQSTLQRAAAAMVASGSGKRKTFKVDAQCPHADEASVVDDYDCMLNKTDIKANNNKYYLIQLHDIPDAEYYATWTRWGRVGDPANCFHGQAVLGPFSEFTDAEKAFEKKFRDKTGTNWKDRHNFKGVKNKYQLIEMGEDDEDVTTVSVDEGRLQVYAQSKLDEQTRMFVRFIFDKDMFKKAMLQLSFDVQKMPLGKLSKGQIAKGFQILDEINKAIDKKQTKQYTDLTSKFYTQIPHSFGMKRPPVMSTKDEVREKMDNLLVLGDIELAQTLQQAEVKKAIAAKKEDLPPHPLDVQYNLLQCDLNPVEKSSKEFKIIDQYVSATKGGSCKKIKNVWTMDRKPEQSRFKKHDSIKERKLLWHGTNVAVCVAICKDGLRIMPHSGGRVGKGIYFASENAKSAAYVRSVDKTGVMFLNEVVLGKQHGITQDNSSLVKPPSGYNSVVALGQQEPDPSKDVKLKMDGHDVVVPGGQPKNRKEYSSSSFYQSEYLVYDESQVRMRYLLQMEWTY